MSEALPVRILSTVEEVRSFADSLAGVDEIALDTEFHGERRYTPELMLVQIATRESITLVDPLRGADLRPLLEAIARSNALVIGHSIHNDLALFARHFDVLPRRCFDTQVAGAFLGHGEQPGLQRLLETVLSVHLAKSYTMSDWSRRPLPKELVSYAAADVEHLFALADTLRAELRARGRLEWVEEECAALCTLERYALRDPEEAWTRVRRPKRPMTPTANGVLRALAAERELIARELDAPATRVLHDDLLVDLAARLPRKLADVARSANRQQGPGLDKHAARWLAAIERGLLAPVAAEHHAVDLDADAVVSLALLLLASIARREQLVPSLFHLRDTLPEAALHPPIDRADSDRRLGLSGWRAALVGEPLYRLLSGQSAGLVARAGDRLRLDWT